MSDARDRDAEATLLEALPRETEGQAQYRELISGTLDRCFERAGTMTPEGRRKLHIELADGSVIDTAGIAVHFGDPPGATVDMKPTDLL